MARRAAPPLSAPPLSAPRLSLQRRVMLLAGAAVAVVLLGDAVARQLSMEHDGRVALRERAALLVSIQGDAMSVPMWNLDEDQVRAVLNALAADPDFVAAAVIKPDGRVLEQRRAQHLPATQASTIDVTHDITYLSRGQPRILGTLHFSVSTVRLNAALASQWQERAVALIVLLAAVLLAVYGALRQFTDPLDKMTQALTRLAAGDRDTPIPARDQDDEVGAVARALQVFRDTAFRLVKAEGAYRALFENAALGIFGADETGHVHSFNAAMMRICGFADEASLTAALERPDEEGLYIAPGRGAALQQLLRAQGGFVGELSEIRRGDGGKAWVSQTARAVRDDTGRVLGFAGTVEDVSGRVRRQGEERLRVRAAMESASDAILIVDDGLVPLFANPAFVRCFGPIADPPMALGGLPARLRDPAAASGLADALGSGQAWQGEADITTAGGGTTPMLIRASMIFDEQGASFGAVLICTDLSDRRRAEAQIRHTANHDWLTGLPNRMMFLERLAAALQQTALDGSAFALMCIDLDRFKAVNDMLGHAAGDRLLQSVACRLRDVVRDEDTVARIGGDEFTLIQMGIIDPGEAMALAERVVAALAEPFEVHGREVQIGASIGIALAPQHGNDQDSLIGYGDIALYDAKAHGQGQVSLFMPEMEIRRRQHAELERDLRTAALDERLSVDFQPQYHLATGRLVGAEALLRWTDAVRGPVPPQSFIPVAEEIGLIGELGEWVLAYACREAMGWPGDLRVAVNVSPAQFHTGDFISMVRRVLAETGLAPNRLELEITEGVFMREGDETQAALAELKALGVRITLDDFGTGYSSLSYLRRMPLNKIKVDRSFVAALGQDPASHALVRSIIGLAKVLGFETNAEGVETEAQARILRDEGCQEVQGFHFGRPMPAPDFASLAAACPVKPALARTA